MTSQKTLKPGNDNAPSGCCPVCEEKTDKAYKPFCSKRCADVDLHRWLNGGYAIPALEDDSEEFVDESSSQY